MSWKITIRFFSRERRERKDQVKKTNHDFQEFKATPFLGAPFCLRKRKMEEVFIDYETFFKKTERICFELSSDINQRDGFRSQRQIPGFWWSSLECPFLLLCDIYIIVFFSYFSFGSKSASELQKTSDNHCIIAIHDVKVDSGNRVFTNVQLSLWLFFFHYL